MNPRRVHELMRERFPSVEAANCGWVVIADDNGLRPAVLDALLTTHVAGSDLLVELHRKCGAMLARQEVTAFVARYLGQGDIRISDREFTGFVLVAASGVATGWSASQPEANAASMSGLLKSPHAAPLSLDDMDASIAAQLRGNHAKAKR